MKLASFVFLLSALLSAVTMFGADRPSIAKIEDQMVSQVESELIPLAEAMPEEKYNFKPNEGQFEGVRTFALQMRHIATVLYEFGADIEGVKPKVEMGTHENGSDNLKGKAAIVDYLKGSFQSVHEALATITDANATEPVTVSWGKTTRLELAQMCAWHSYDHYGQAVVYLRLNGIVPPASRK